MQGKRAYADSEIANKLTLGKIRLKFGPARCPAKSSKRASDQSIKEQLLDARRKCAEFSNYFPSCDTTGQLRLINDDFEPEVELNWKPVDSQIYVELPRYQVTTALAAPVHASRDKVSQFELNSYSFVRVRIENKS